jgi:hypothetical protein
LQDTSVDENCPCCTIVNEVSNRLGSDAFYPAFQNRASFLIYESTSQQYVNRARIRWLEERDARVEDLILRGDWPVFLQDVGIHSVQGMTSGRKVDVTVNAETQFWGQI